MAKKVSDLPAGSSVEPDDLLMAVQGGNNKSAVGSLVVGGWETLETIDVVAFQSRVTFSGLNGDVDGTYRIIGRWTNGSLTSEGVFTLMCMLNGTALVAADISSLDENSYNIDTDTLSDTSVGATTSTRVAQLSGNDTDEVAVIEISIPAVTGVARTFNAHADIKDENGGEAFLRSGDYVVFSDVSANITSIALETLEDGELPTADAIAAGSSFTLQRLRK